MRRLLTFQQRRLRLEPLRSPRPLRGTAGVRLSVGSSDPLQIWEYEYWLDWSLSPYAYQLLPSPLMLAVLPHKFEPLFRCLYVRLVADDRFRSL